MVPFYSLGPMLGPMLAPTPALTRPLALRIDVELAPGEIERELDALHERIQFRAIYHPPGTRLHWTRYRHLEHVVMSMPAGIVAFTKQLLILFFREMRAVQAMRRGKLIDMRHLHRLWLLFAFIRIALPLGPSFRGRFHAHRR